MKKGKKVIDRKKLKSKINVSMGKKQGLEVEEEA